ncbi:MAG: ABC-F family ATP-binding cassette domain-containing protein, partial [Bacteroidales bacterium]|nr:ABC-F family ATP-binding cassette domain-containing protein [Bacteroidales bacterium]
DYLKSFRGSLLLVSHDRKFLDNVTTRTVEILLGHIHDYKVPYSQYVTLRAERIAQQTAAYENQQRMIEKTEDFINRFRYKPTKSNQVQSRIKALEKLDRIEIDETDDAKLNLRFPPAARSGDVVFKGTDLTVGYPQKIVFRDAEVEIKRGEKVALIGRNGEGKTTLMRVIMGELEPVSGEARVGHNVHIGYYAQNQEDILDKNETVFSTLDRIAVGEIRTKLRDLLGAFLFRGEDIDKRVSVLSGGERARLGMAKLMLQSYNVLALDEPTNHMDIRSKDRLKQALQAFDGTLIVVSHDRDFLEGLVDKLYEFRDGKVKEHLGGVSDFLARRKLESLQELERLAPVEKVADERKTQAQETFQARKTVTKEMRKIQNRVDYLEKEIGKLEKRQGAIEKVLSAPGPGDDVMELTREYLENKRSLDAFTEEWSVQMEKLEN